jgi:hypothetical protein
MSNLSNLKLAFSLSELNGHGAEILLRGDGHLIAGFYDGILFHKALRIVGPDDSIEDIYVDATAIRLGDAIASLETLSLIKEAA